MLGGAEAALREMAYGLRDRGHAVEVLTTTARNHFTWADELPAGVTDVGGIPVHRFPTVMSHNRIERGVLEGAIMAGHELNAENQQRWLNGLFRVPGLYEHIVDHGDEYDVLVFAPYLFWTTAVGALIRPAKSALLACLHDEPHARLEVLRPLFTSLADVWFMSPPERDLATRIHGGLPPRHALTGCGVPVPAAYDPEGFRRRHGIEGRFVLYAGRREGGKGWETFLAQFADATVRARLPFSLVTFGGGDITVPASLTGRVVDLGFIDEAEKPHAFAAADAYIQPSRLEAFSRTIMEAWLAGTLVIGNGGGDVVRYHVETSRAGLLYEDEWELEECLAFVADSPDAAARIAAAGREYVLGSFTWDRVLDVVERRLAEVGQ